MEFGNATRGTAATRMRFEKQFAAIRQGSRRFLVRFHSSRRVPCARRPIVGQGRASADQIRASILPAKNGAPPKGAALLKNCLPAPSSKKFRNAPGPLEGRASTDFIQGSIRRARPDVALTRSKTKTRHRSRAGFACPSAFAVAQRAHGERRSASRCQTRGIRKLDPAS